MPIQYFLLVLHICWGLAQVVGVWGGWRYHAVKVTQSPQWISHPSECFQSLAVKPKGKSVPETLAVVNICTSPEAAHVLWDSLLELPTGPEKCYPHELRDQWRSVWPSFKACLHLMMNSMALITVSSQ